MEKYQTKSRKLPGTQFSEISKQATRLYQTIKKKTKRRPYVRSTYFRKEKIFLPLFWQHLHEKMSHKDKARRLKYFPCGIELLKNCRSTPIIKPNPNKKSEILYRFTGITPDGEIFFVQVKESKGNKEKWLISIFPDEE
jgi:hypothetical protein